MPRILSQQGETTTHQEKPIIVQPIAEDKEQNVKEDVVAGNGARQAAGFTPEDVVAGYGVEQAAVFTPQAAPAQIAIPTITNQQVPLVIFVGPSRSGKSMVLVRLSQYLRNDGYTIQTDPTFLNTPQYLKGCEDFNKKLNSNEALDPTTEFLLVDVYKDSHLVAKLLEAPGEDFYSIDNEERNRGTAPYLNTIVTSPNPKAYVMLLDLDSDVSFRRDTNHRNSYAARLLNPFYRNVDKNRDRVILLYNKIDCTQYGDINGCNNEAEARNDAETNYPSLFATMKRNFLVFWKIENFAFKTFCTGMFSDQVDNMGNTHKVYNVASEVYPRDLWNAITKRFL